MENKKDEALKKIDDQFNTYKKNVIKMSPEKLYSYSTNNVFMGGILYHLKNLITADDGSLSSLILKDDKNLESALNYIERKVQEKYGLQGDFSTEEFHTLIWEYYKMDSSKVKKILHRKSTMTVSAESKKKKLDIPHKKSGEPAVKGSQISLFQ